MSCSIFFFQLRAFLSTINTVGTCLWKQFWPCLPFVIPLIVNRVIKVVTVLYTFQACFQTGETGHSCFTCFIGILYAIPYIIVVLYFRLQCVCIIYLVRIIINPLYVDYGRTTNTQFHMPLLAYLLFLLVILSYYFKYFAVLGISNITLFILLQSNAFLKQ